jgi:hypothetical protein
LLLYWLNAVVPGPVLPAPVPSNRVFAALRPRED